MTERRRWPLRLIPRSLSATRCPYCHDTVPLDEAVQCRSCGVGYHADCWQALRCCATLGCEVAVTEAEAWGEWQDTVFGTRLHRSALVRAGLGGIVLTALVLTVSGLAALPWIPVMALGGTALGLLLFRAVEAP